MSTYSTTRAPVLPDNRSVLPVARTAAATFLDAAVEEIDARDVTLTLTLSAPVQVGPGTLRLPVWDTAGAVAVREFIPYSVRPPNPSPSTMQEPSVLPVTLNEARTTATVRVEAHFPGTGQSIATPISTAAVYLMLGTLRFTPDAGGRLRHGPRSPHK